MNHVFLRTYYSLLFLILFRQAYFFINAIPSQITEYIMFASPLSLFEPPIEIHSIIFLFGLFSCLLCIFYPHKYLKIISSVFVLFLFSITFSYGKIHHSSHIWMISSILMVFFFLDKPLKSKINYFMLRLMQALLLSHYFISGLWKIRSLLSSKFAFSFKEIVSEYIAYGLAESGIEANMFLKILLYQYPELLSFGFLCVLLFQLTSIIPFFLDKFFILYGVLAILFHLSTGIVLGVYFTPTVLAVLFFLIISEEMIKNERIL